MLTRDEIISMARPIMGDIDLPGHFSICVFVGELEKLMNLAYQSGRNAGLKEAADSCEKLSAFTGCPTDCGKVVRGLMKEVK